MLLVKGPKHTTMAKRLKTNIFGSIFMLFVVINKYKALIITVIAKENGVMTAISL